MQNPSTIPIRRGNRCDDPEHRSPPQAFPVPGEFLQAEGLSEHVASVPAVLRPLRGEAKPTPGGGLRDPGPFTALG
jgi:hypothetical protein